MMRRSSLPRGYRVLALVHPGVRKDIQLKPQAPHSSPLFHLRHLFNAPGVWIRDSVRTQAPVGCILERTGGNLRLIIPQSRESDHESDHESWGVVPQNSRSSALRMMVHSVLVIPHVAGCMSYSV